jgi:hypothetical protein
MFRKKLTFEEFLIKLGNSPMVLKLAKRENKILGIEFTDITYLPYVVLKHEIPELTENKKYEEVIYEIVKYRKKDAKFNDVKKLDNYTKLRFFLWVQDQYKKINELEKRYLTTPPDPKMQAAGIQELDILGDTNLIDALANGDVLKWKEVSELPYSTIFDKQLKMTIEAKIARKLNKQQTNGYS